MVTKIWLTNISQRRSWSESKMFTNCGQAKTGTICICTMDSQCTKYSDLFTDAVKQLLSIFLLFNLALNNSTLFMHNTEHFCNINKNVLWRSDEHLLKLSTSSMSRHFIVITMQRWSFYINNHWYALEGQDMRFG